MRTWLRVVLLLISVGGGFAGAVLTLPYVSHPTSFSNFMVGVFLFSLYIFVTISGLLFALNPAKTWPLFTSLLFQIPYISSSLVVYKFGAGCHFFLLIGPPETPGRTGLFFGFDGLFGSSCKFGFAEDAPWRIGINLVALVICMLLGKAVYASAQQVPKTAKGASIPVPTQVST